MYRKHLSALITGLAIISVMFCCKKEDYYAPVAPSLNELFSDLRSTPQNLTVTAGIAQTVVAANGTALNFYPNSFKDAAGNIITSGTVNIQITEMYGPGSMIQNRATTTDADGSALQSGGQVYINATMGSNTVYANKYGIAFKQPDASTQPMALYFAGTGNSDSVTNWNVGDTTKKGTIVKGTVKDTARKYSPSESFYFIFDSCTDFNWINCDYRWGDGYTFTDVELLLDKETANGSNTQVYMVYPDIKSTMRMYPEKNIVFSLRRAPVGVNYKIAVISKIDDQYYYAEKKGVITDTLKLTATLHEETRYDIIARLGGL